jgi:hypothetical protein
MQGTVRLTTAQLGQLRLFLFSFAGPLVFSVFAMISILPVVSNFPCAGLAKKRPDARRAKWLSGQLRHWSK